MRRDVEWYYRLAPEVRARVDDWLRREDLINKMIVEVIAVSEGFVEVRRVAGEPGHPVTFVDPVGQHDFVMIDMRYPVKTPPPPEVFLDG